MRDLINPMTYQSSYRMHYAKSDSRLQVDDHLSQHRHNMSDIAFWGNLVAHTIRVSVPSERVLAAHSDVLARVCLLWC